jgi:hypothetical protein
MTKTVTALLAAAILATATCALLTTAHARCVGCAVGADERPAEAPPGYVCTIPAMGNSCQGPIAIGSACPSTTLTATWSAGRGVQWLSAPG